MKNCLENVGANIRKIRKDLRMTIEDLSEKSGLSAKYLQGVETAKNNISIVNLENISKALQVDMSEIIETNCDAFKKSEEKLFHISSRLKRYDARQLTFVYEMLDIIEEFEKSDTASLLMQPRYSKGPRRKVRTA